MMLSLSFLLLIFLISSPIPSHSSSPTPAILNSDPYVDVAVSFFTLVRASEPDMKKIEALETPKMQQSTSKVFWMSFFKTLVTFDSIFDVTSAILQPGVKLVTLQTGWHNSVAGLTTFYNTTFQIPVCYTSENSENSDSENSDSYLVCSFVMNYVFSAPPYANPTKFVEIDFNGIGPLQLPGTLTLPVVKTTMSSVVGVDPSAIVFIVPGSGPTDRDCTEDGDKTYRDIAWGITTLTSGTATPIGVLRYQKSSNFCSHHFTNPLCQQMIKNGTIEGEYMHDAKSALSLLKQKYPDSKLIVLGHSLGGSVAPLIAQQNRELVDGMISFSGGFQPWVEMVIRQDTYIYEEGGKPLSPEQKEQMIEMAKVDQLLKEGKLPDDYPLPKDLVGLTPIYLSYFYSYNKLATATNVATSGLPMMFTNGERDYQVTIANDFNYWKANLSVFSNVEFKAYDGLTHLYYQAWADGTPSYPAEYQTPGHVRKDVLLDLINFISKVKSRRW